MIDSLKRVVGVLGCLGATLLLIEGGHHSANAASFAFFDLDETIFKCREGGQFLTKVRLFQVGTRSNMLMAPPAPPAEIEVTCADFDAMKPFLAANDTQLGNVIDRPFTLLDGRQIIPGFYYFDPTHSFNPYYYESTDGRNFPIEDFDRAQVMAQNSGVQAWKGPAFPILQYLLSRPDTAATTALATARAQRQSLQQLFQERLVAQGHLQHMPNFPLSIFAASWELDKFDRNPRHISVRKSLAWEEFAWDLRRLDLDDGDLRADLDRPASAPRKRYHVMLIADDNQHTLQLTARRLSRIVMSRAVRLKVIIINLGTEAEVQNAAAGGMPRYSVINSTGLFREASAHEVFGEHSHMTAKQAEALMAQLPPQVSAPSSCKEFLGTPQVAANSTVSTSEPRK